MKKVLCTVFSFFKRILLFLKVHLHVEAGVRLKDKDEQDENGCNPDVEASKRRKG